MGDGATEEGVGLAEGGGRLEVWVKLRLKLKG